MPGRLNNQKFSQEISQWTDNKAVRIYEFSGLDALRYEDIPIPKPGPDEVLIKVAAASVNPVDWQLAYGINQEFLQRTLPTIPGFDVAGTVAEIGSNVTEFRPGDSVYGHTDFRRDGSFTHFMVSSAHHLAPMPKNLNFVEAAAVPVAALAAWCGLFGDDAIDLKKGQSVLIHAGAGGVGSFAIQMAKWIGASIITTASKKNHDFLEKLGADQVIDYHNEHFDQLIDRVDGVLDAIGGDTQLRSVKLIKENGTLASLVGEQWGDDPRDSNIRKMVVHGGFYPQKLREITPLIESGHIYPVISDVIPIAEFKRALQLNQYGQVRGKIVIHME